MECLASTHSAYAQVGLDSLNTNCNLARKNSTNIPTSKHAGFLRISEKKNIIDQTKIFLRSHESHDLATMTKFHTVSTVATLFTSISLTTSFDIFQCYLCTNFAQNCIIIIIEILVTTLYYLAISCEVSQ